MLFEKAALISGLLDYLFILVFCLIGSIVKDTYNTIIEKNPRVDLTRILISTLVSSIILFSTSDYITKIMNWKMFVLPCFVGGMIGFELLGKINKLSFWLRMYKKKKDIIDRIISQSIEDEE